MAWDFEAGEILLFDKPLQWTSFDVVNKVRHLIRQKIGKKLKVGHAGTLDPLATGLLIVCTGAKTKIIDSIQSSDKHYLGEMLLGETTPSFDAETAVDHTYPTAHITEEMVHATAQTFLGAQLQVPPIYSAIKVGGKKMYEQARKQKIASDHVLEPRPVVIHQLAVLHTDLPKVGFHVHCSKGTYIRSLVRDWGTRLGSGAYMTALARTQIGEFTLAQALSLADFEAQLKG